MSATDLVRKAARRKGRPLPKPTKRRTHLIIPDTQVHPDSPTFHLAWINEYIREKSPDVLVHLGDHWDMPSLSSYDKGKRSAEGLRYVFDAKAGNEAFAVLNKSVVCPEKHFLLGNHEERIERAANDHAAFAGKVGYHDLETADWRVHNFLDVLVVDGVHYSHYFVNHKSGRSLGGMVPTRIKTLGFPFVQGHQQGLEVGTHTTIHGMYWGVVSGSCYLHSHSYRKQAADDNCWHGIVVLHDVHDGLHDPMFVSLDYLCRRYENTDLISFKQRYCR